MAQINVNNFFEHCEGTQQILSKFCNMIKRKKKNLIVISIVNNTNIEILKFICT